MATPANPLPSDYYKIRAEEFRTRYESMRTLEWQILLQTYGGYGAIALAFHKLFGDTRLLIGGRPLLVACGAMAATLLFSVGMYYLYYRVEERLISFDYDHEYYLRQLDMPDRARGFADLGHKYFWMYDTQMVIGSIVATGLFAYEGFGAAPLGWNLTITALAACAILLWCRGRRRLGGLEAELGQIDKDESTKTKD